MTREQLRLVIEELARAYGVTFTDGLIDRILEDVGQGSGRLPLLEFALTQLWQRQEGRRLSYGAYQAVGGVRGALAQHAEQVYASLGRSEQQAAQRVFGQLVMTGDGVADTRRVASRTDLPEEDWPIVQRLADERLVVTDLDEAQQERVQITHEALIPRLGPAPGVGRHRPGVPGLAGADAGGRAPVGVERARRRRPPAGALLMEAQRWHRERPSEVDERVAQFLLKSRSAEARELLVRAENSAARGNFEAAVAS